MAKRTLDDMLGQEPSEPSEAQAVDPIEAAAPRPVYTTGKVFDASDVITPRLALAQGLSPEVRERKAEVGDWLLMGHDPVKEVILVIAGHSDQRRYVPMGQQKAECWSPDGKQGYGNPGIKCADCPLSKWQDSGRLKPNGQPHNTPPPCSEIDSFVAFSVTHGMPVTWPLKGTAAKKARFIKTLCNGLGMGNFAIKVTSIDRSENGRAWQEPEVVIDQSVSKEEAQAYAMIAAQAVVTTDALPAQSS